MIAVRSLLGIGGIPVDRTSAGQWLQRRGIKVQKAGATCRSPDQVALSDLPPPVRLAFTERQIATAGLAQGTYDDDAHARFFEAPAGMRAAAERAAAIARYMVPRRGVVQWADLVAQVRAQFGAKGCSDATLRRILDDVALVDPINFAPALLADHKGKTARAEISDEAWSFFHDNDPRCWAGVSADTGMARCARCGTRDVLAVAKLSDCFSALAKPARCATASRARRSYRGRQADRATRHARQDDNPAT